MDDNREYTLETLGSWAHHPYRLKCLMDGKAGTPKFYGDHAEAEKAGRAWVATGVQPADQRD